MAWHLIDVGINSSKPRKSDDYSIQNPRNSNNNNNDPLFPKTKINNSPSSLLVLSYSSCTVYCTVPARYCPSLVVHTSACNAAKICY